MQPTTTQAGFCLSHAVIAMAGAQDRSLLSLFFDEEPPEIDPALNALRTMARAALMEAQQLLEQVLIHADNAEEIAQCRQWVREAEACIAWANQARRGQSSAGLMARIQGIVAAVRSESVAIDGHPTKMYGGIKKVCAERYPEVPEAAPPEAKAVVHLTGELEALLRTPLAQHEPPAERQSRVRGTLGRLSRAAHRLVDAGKQAVEAVKASAQYLADGTVRISRRAVDGWRYLRAAAINGYNRLWDLFDDSAPSSVIDTVIDSAPLPTLSSSNARVLEGVIGTLRPFAIQDVIEISPHHRILASEVAGIVSRGGFIILPYRP